MANNALTTRNQSGGGGGGDESDKADLFVFGYACKLFRDDEKAEMIENGSHLIPWMGDEKLQIDRYDGRGALYDLTQYEAQSENMDWTDIAEDCEEDQLCEYERYRSLYLEEVTEQTYKEECAKRSHGEHAEIAYEYDNPVNGPSLPDTETEITVDKPFVPPAELQLPPNIQIPTTVKHNAIIVRTALFLAQQGSQMEILMKVKQQSNRNFDFLSHTDQLHEYYKHVLGLIKSGAYVPQEQHLDDTTETTATTTATITTNANVNVQELETETNDGHYLHPSLIKNKVVNILPSSSSTLPLPPPPQLDTKPTNIETEPPDFVQKIIEKMVKYVIKNGPVFETAILKRGDVRFSFLNTKNPYNSFYKEQLAAKQKLLENSNLNLKNKIKEVIEQPEQKQQPQQQQQQQVLEEDDETKLEDLMSNRKPIAVSFSIKKPKENEGLEVPSALPVEESSDEDETILQNNSNSPKLLNTTTITTNSTKITDIEPQEFINTLDKRLKKSAEITRKHKLKKDSNLQNERKLKVAQFLKDLKKKNC